MKLPAPRLLPVVIAAIAALIIFKGIGILTSGAYVLGGTRPAVAQEGASSTRNADGTADLNLPLSQDVTATDTSPTASDGATTIPLAASPSAPADAHAPPAEAKPAPEHDTAAETAPPSSDCPTAPPPPKPDPNANPDQQGFNNFIRPSVDCPVDPGTNAEGDALPLTTDGGGKVQPMAQADPGDVGSEPDVLKRLSERRDDLDKRAKDLDMREALVAAAEKRIDQRTGELKALEDKINALLVQKKTDDDQQFTALVTMYETMKPKEAAAIFDQLGMPVLVRVAGAMNPRKMSPVLAAMTPAKAKDLTDALAAAEAAPEPELTQNDLASLPQIVGQ